MMGSYVISFLVVLHKEDGFGFVAGLCCDLLLLLILLISFCFGHYNVP